MNKKKVYHGPNIAIISCCTPLMNGASVNNVKGDAGITSGSGDIPTQSDSRRVNFYGEDDD